MGGRNQKSRREAERHGAARRETAPQRVSRLLDGTRSGSQPALNELIPLVYDELRRIAARHLRRERPGQTLQATALVHEAYARLLGEKHPRWQNRAHFLAIAANSMRQILVERARAHHALKRGGGFARITFDEAIVGAGNTSVDLLALDDALRTLAALDARQARVVELRFFGGLTVGETAEVLEIAPATVKRDWILARAWLARQLARKDFGES